MVEVLSVIDATIRAVSVWLLCVVLLILMGWLALPAQDCWIPPGAPTRAFYEKCWTFDEVRHQ